MIFDRLYSATRRLAANSNSTLLSLAATYGDYDQFMRRIRPIENKADLRSQTGLVNEALDKLRQTGIHIIEDFWEQETCAEARAEVDRLIEEYPDALHSVAKADFRIYGAENVSALIKQFATDDVLQEISSSYNCTPTRTAFTLAAKMPAMEGNKGSGEGWHRDAFLRQFKAILYLTDVELENGPFQFIKRSHQKGQVLQDIWAADLGYNQYRIKEEQIERLLKADEARLETFTAKAGTLILVDTSSIHRGMPIKAGTRYALTNYFFSEKQIDEALYEKFNVLRP